MVGSLRLRGGKRPPLYYLPFWTGEWDEGEAKKVTAGFVFLGDGHSSEGETIVQGWGGAMTSPNVPSNRAPPMPGDRANNLDGPAIAIFEGQVAVVFQACVPLDSFPRMRPRES